MSDKTLAVIKPDAVKAGNADEIKQLIELHGFTIIIQQKFQVCARKHRCSPVVRILHSRTLPKACGRIPFGNNIEAAAHVSQARNLDAPNAFPHSSPGTVPRSSTRSMWASRSFPGSLIS
eukprot:515055-Pelagomonas_calceolata.AAC.1